MKSLLSLISVLLALGIANPVAAIAQIRVVASIKPVHSLLAGIMAGTGKPYLVVKGSSSPHNYALKPSDASALQTADIIFQIGKTMETFLQKPLQSLGERAQVISLLDNPKLVKLQFSEKSPSADIASGDGEHEHENDQINPHIWLDPQNARIMVQQISQALCKADRDNCKTYRQNAKIIDQELVALDAETRTLLVPVKTRPFIVFHDAFLYFENRYGLNKIAMITTNPAIRPGARHLRQITKLVLDKGAVCAFSEPQFNLTNIGLIAEGTGIKTAILDPLGADLPDGPPLYFSLLRNMATTISSCLTR